MSDWLHNLPILWMALVVFGFTYLLTAAIQGLVAVLAKGERARAFKAISPGLLSPLAIIFGLFVAFTAAQVWSDNDRANAAVDREASTLRAISTVSPHSGGDRFGRNRSKEDRRDSPALLSGLGSQELRGVYRVIQITALIAINANSKISIIKFNPKRQFFWGIDGWQFEQANLEGPNPRNHGVA